jgi:hypothetical protein
MAGAPVPDRPDIHGNASARLKFLAGAKDQEMKGSDLLVAALENEGSNVAISRLSERPDWEVR